MTQEIITAEGTDAAVTTGRRVDGLTIPTAAWSKVEEKGAIYRAALRDYVDRVNAKDVEGILALFAEDGVVTDPYGGTRHNIKGKSALREFYRFAVQKMRQEVQVVTGSGGNAAAMAIRAYVGSDVCDNISVACFDDDDKIILYTTYWGPGDRHTVD
jgi:steroid delta-isomerase